MKKIIIPLIAGVILLIGYLFFLFLNQSRNIEDISRVKTLDQLKNENGDGFALNQGDQEKIEVIARDLQIPWEIVFLPDGSFLITERVGNLVRIDSNSEERISVSGVEHRGEGGLLGMDLHPDFENNSYIYLYMTTVEGGGLSNRVERYTFDLENNSLNNKTEIISDIPGAIYHDGGRISFGPDGLLYIATGDAGVENSAQNKNSLAGKILRINMDGSIPEDNPFGNEVYSYGHRNVQGLTWDEEGRLWATEHGRSGILSGFDELNLIERGANYGWPIIQGDESREGMKTPVVHSGSNTTWAPSGAAYFRGSIFFAGLRGEALYEYKTEKNILTEHINKEYGRLRQIIVGPDNNFYILTNNTDGRGNPEDGDDKIIKLNGIIQI